MADDKKPQKVTPIIIDGFEINAQNVAYQRLQEFSLRLYEKLLNVRRERNFLMLDRDKHRTILENCHHEIKEAKNIGDNKETELEQAQSKYQQDLKEVDQEVKYILYDHDVKLTEVESWEKNMLAKNAEKNLAEELEFLEKKRKLKEELLNQAEKNEDELRNIKIHQEEEINNLIKKLDKSQIENDIEFKKSLQNLVDSMSLKHEMEMSELEERKNTHLAQLKEIHKARLNEIKNHFNSITAENLVVISSLKQSLDNMKKSKNAMLEDVKDLKKENTRLKDPLERSKAEVKKLTRHLINYEKDLLSLKNNKRLLQKTLVDTKQIKKETLSTLRAIKINENFNTVENLDNSCLFSIMAFKDCTARKRDQLEVMVKEMIEDLILKQKAIQKLTVDPDILNTLAQMNFEYWNPRKLYLDLATACKAHDEFLAMLEMKLYEFCITEKEFNFSLSNDTYMSSNPSALISKQ